MTETVTLHVIRGDGHLQNYVQCAMTLPPDPVEGDTVQVDGVVQLINGDVPRRFTATLQWPSMPEHGELWVTIGVEVIQGAVVLRVNDHSFLPSGPSEVPLFARFQRVEVAA